MSLFKTALLTLATLLVLSATLNAQVKIGNPPGAPDPKAVLELSDTTRGFLLPRLNNTQMNAISAPPDGLLIYNNERRSVYQYRQSVSQWAPLVADSSEWVYDSASTRMYLRRGLNAGDTIFYRGSKKMFFFGDTRMYGTSSGGVFNLDDNNYDRFVFKTTASRFYRDSFNLNSANIYSIYEVDRDTMGLNYPLATLFTGIRSDVTVTPSAIQQIGQLTGIQSVTTFAGKDTSVFIIGNGNTVFLRGKGYVEQVMGFNNQVGIRDSVQALGTVFGINNSLSYISPLGTPRIEGDYYGYMGSMSTAFNNKVNGNAYGIYLRNVTGAAPNNNFALFTNKGLNRLGDSTLITDQTGFLRPRAVLDVNATSSMIIPVGTTVQRPVTGISGMLRYNSDNLAPEYYNGSSWNSMKSPVISGVAAIDCPPVGANSTVSTGIFFSGAAVGNTVTLAPTVNLPAGVVIAWARVNGPNSIVVAFGNVSTGLLDPPSINFDIKLIQ